ncbi:MAG: NAD(P)-binding domain-containing protein [Candidatus Saccharibacteria bacterium]
MKIGMIGSGEVAQSLSVGLLAAGHSVMVGTREPKKKALLDWNKNQKKKAKIGSTTEAAGFGEIAILAIAWHATEDVLSTIRPELAGKVVIDLTNPIIFNDDEAPSLAIGHTMSGGEIVQQCLPDSHIVKTLNYISHANMVNPKYKQGSPIMFVCGNNKSAKCQVRDLLQDLGWEDMLNIGTLEKSRLLESLSLLWIEYGVSRDTWNHAFAVLEE